MELIIILTLVFGVVGWSLHLFFISISLLSKPKFTLEIDYNRFKEGYFEVIIIVILIFMSIFSIGFYVI
ncbi:unnamed protein product [marine sediment metagenome]|uniref:Uncharacterized protein n=1 Tax=marine sediment metagenome TaxID=412755 RepID=X1HVX4_9ZZZZ